MTLKFLDGIRQGTFLGYISVRVIEEIRKASQPKQDNLLKIVAQFPLESLPLTDEVKVLADRYIEEKVIPEKERNDAVHIAVASIEVPAIFHS